MVGFPPRFKSFSQLFPTAFRFPLSWHPWVWAAQGWWEEILRKNRNQIRLTGAVQFLSCRKKKVFCGDADLMTARNHCCLGKHFTASVVILHEKSSPALVRQSVSYPANRRFMFIHTMFRKNERSMFLKGFGSTNPFKPNREFMSTLVAVYSSFFSHSARGLAALESLT